jgi:hypothetical protein
MKEFGHVNVARFYNDGGTLHLGKWVAIQRYDYKNKTLKKGKSSKA